MYKSFLFLLRGILGFGADMCVYKMHTIASCLEFEAKKIQTFFLDFTREN